MLEADADHVLPVLRTGVLGQIPSSRLGVPAGAGHHLAADRAEIFLAAHVAHRSGLVLVVVEDAATDAAGDLGPVQTVLMLAQGAAIFGDALFEIELRTDLGRVEGVAQGVMRLTGRLDVQHLQGRGEGLLVVAAAGLGVEHHLRVVPVLNPDGVVAVEHHVGGEQGNVVEAPGQKDAVVSAPVIEFVDRLVEGEPFGLELAFADAGELCHAAVEAAEKLGLDQNLKFIGDGLILQHPHRADLDDLAADMDGQHPLGGVRTRPRLVPLHIQNNIFHVYLS